MRCYHITGKVSFVRRLQFPDFVCERGGGRNSIFYLVSLLKMQSACTYQLPYASHLYYVKFQRARLTKTVGVKLKSSRDGAVPIFSQRSFYSSESRNAIKMSEAL